MNDPLTTPSENQSTSQVIPSVGPPKKIDIQHIKEKVASISTNLLHKLKETKFYKNKLIFWPITIMVSLVFITLVLGLIFGNRGTSPVIKTPIATPTPQAQNPQQLESGGVLGQIEQNLNKIREQIMAFDVHQSRLKAPTVNFDVKF